MIPITKAGLHHKCVLTYQWTLGFFCTISLSKFSTRSLSCPDGSNFFSSPSSCKVNTSFISGFFSPVLWEGGLHPWDWENQWCFVKNWEKMHDSNCAIYKMKTNNHCLGWQLQSFKHSFSDVAFVSNIFYNFYSNFITFNKELFHGNSIKKDTIFNSKTTSRL